MKKTANLLLATLLICLLTGCAWKGAQQKEPVKLVLWHYYNDSQKEYLDELITEYNESAGAEAQIEVESYSQGTVNELSDKVDMALNHSTNDVTGMDMFLAYRDITIQILKENPAGLVNYKDYFTEEELGYYNEAYLREGYFGEGLYILPMVKSTELLLMNQDRLEEFWAANPIYGAKDLETWEGLEASAQAYYEWTDAMTPEIGNDGQAFIGMDVLANYFIVQNNALGSSIYSYEEDGLRFELKEDIIDRLFASFYIPYTKGYYGSYGKYRSDDLRQSLLAGYIGSSSSISYFPKTIMSGDGEEKPIQLGIYEYPYFTNGVKTAVQQGAGVTIVAGEREKEEACIHFLKWLTQEKGVELASGLSYMPVGRVELSEQQLSTIEPENIRKGIETGMRQCSHYKMVYGFDFETGYKLRQELTEYMTAYLQTGREEFGGYLEQGMSMEEAAEAMDYQDKKAAFYDGIVNIFKEAM